VSGRWPTLDGAPTRVIAHRGASGPLPEHTLPAYRQALADGADVLEPDLVVTRDGVLMVRHDRGLARSTDIAARPEFAAQRVAGDWPIERYSRRELDPLRAIQPWPQRSHQHDGCHDLLDFQQLLAWADGEGARRSTPLTLYPELKHPAAFAAAGIDPVPRLVEAIRAQDASRLRFWFQCFDFEALHRVRAALGVPCYLLVEAPCDWEDVLARCAGVIDGLGASKALLTLPDGTESGLVAQAHARGLQVHAWTYRDDQPAPGCAGVAEELNNAFALGVDAVFCDFPATGIACRAAWAASHA
jgi:glycerophosphoryl diester phosphodiesterase